MITFEEISEFDLDLLDIFSQEKTINLTKNFQHILFMEDFSQNSNKENENVTALPLD